LTLQAHLTTRSLQRDLERTYSTRARLHADTALEASAIAVACVPDETSIAARLQDWGISSRWPSSFEAPSEAQQAV